MRGLRTPRMGRAAGEVMGAALDGNAGVLPPAARRALRRWERLWGAQRLTTSITVRFSSRLRASLGRATPATGRITLHTALRSAPVERLLEVLCHEVAHIAAVRRAAATGAPRPRAHGAEWAALVRAAGFTPAVRTRESAGNAVRSVATTLRRAREHPRRLVVVHTCPVCHTERHARRAVPAWRCAECVAAGLDGTLVITRRERRGGA